MKFKLTSQYGQFKGDDVAKMEALGFRLTAIADGMYGATHKIVREDRWVEFTTLEDLLAFTTKAGPVIVFGVAGDQQPPGNAMQQGDVPQIHLANGYLDFHAEY